MICIPVKIPRELCALDDELKAIYHSDAANMHLDFSVADGAQSIR